jgi:hypothetical protein
MLPKSQLAAEERKKATLWLMGFRLPMAFRDDHSTELAPAVFAYLH